MRSVLITGCSSGFGLEATLALARRNWRVFATMRDPGKRARLDEAVGKAGAADRVDVVQLDVTDAESIAQATKHVLAETGGLLDGLVNNAGVAHGGFFEELPDEEIRRVFETNFFGVLAVTKAVLPAMRERRSGRIVIVSSDSAFYGAPVASIYHATKWAVEGWAESLQQEVHPFGIRVICVEPGNYATDIWSTSPRIKPEGSPYADAADMLERFVEEKMRPKGRDPREVGAAIAKALEAPNPRFRYPVGPDSKALSIATRLLPYRTVSSGIRRFTGLHRWKP